MKIGYFFSRFPCLSESFGAREIDNLRRMGQEIFVFACDGGDIKDDGVFYGLEGFSFKAFWAILSMVFKEPGWIFRFFCIVVKVFRESVSEGCYLLYNMGTVALFCKQVDDNHIEHIHSYFLSRVGCVGLAVSMLTGRKFSIAAHARDIYVESGAIGVKTRHADFVVCCNRSGQRYLQRMVGSGERDKIFLNYHGVECHWDGGSRKNEEVKVVAVGRLVAKKGVDVFVRAMGEVLKKCNNVRAEIIGDGYEMKRLKELVTICGVGEKVRFCGRLSREEALERIEGADILVAASVVAKDGDRDGIANVVLEAFARGCAVIGSDLEAMQEVVIDGVTGVVFKAGDAAELSEAIVGLVGDRQMRMRLANNGYELVKRNFDGRKNAEELIGVFGG